MPQVRLLWEPRDLWVGAYWDFKQPVPCEECTEHWTLDVYVCLIPVLPLRLRWL